MKKYLIKCLIMLVLSIVASTAKAQTVGGSLNLPLLGTVDLNSMIANSGVIAAYDNHGVKWAGASMRVAWTPADPAQSLADLEVGALWNPASGAPSGITSAVGLRLDNIAAKFGASPFIHKYVGWLPVPAIELGPFGGYLTATRQWIWGVFVAKKIG